KSHEIAVLTLEDVAKIALSERHAVARVVEPTFVHACKRPIVRDCRSRRGHDLHDAPRACPRQRGGLEAALLLRKGENESLIDGVSVARLKRGNRVKAGQVDRTLRRRLGRALLECRHTEIAGERSKGGVEMGVDLAESAG